MQELAKTNKFSIKNLSIFMGEIFEDFFEGLHMILFNHIFRFLKHN